MIMAQSTIKPVVIVGAGPTGLALALWLTFFSIPVVIFDQSTGPGLTSRACIVHARTLEYYRQLGIAEDVIAGGKKVTELRMYKNHEVKTAIRVGDAGKGLSFFPFILAYPQDKHEQLLVKKLEERGVHVQRRTSLIGLEQAADGVRVQIKNEEGEQSIEASYVTGCDGARSTVRQLLGIKMEGGTYAVHFFVADVDLDPSCSWVEGAVNQFFLEKEFCLVFPMDRPNSARVIGFVPDGVAIEGMRFEDIEPVVTRTTKLIATHCRWVSGYNVHARVADRYGVDRTFLLGDACHLHTPVGGQGLNTGVGDASNLAWKLAAVLKGKAKSELLETYEPERAAFAHKLVNTTDYIFTLLTSDGFLSTAMREFIVPYFMPFVSRFDAFRKMQYGLVSQTKIEYRVSALSEGQAYSIRAGDRLPWVMVEDESDNHKSLSTLKWQAHTYGPRLEEDIMEVLNMKDIAVYAYDISAAVEYAGFTRDTLYLIRPDGHIGLLCGRSDKAALTGYLEKWGIDG